MSSFVFYDLGVFEESWPVIECPLILVSLMVPHVLIQIYVSLVGILLKYSIRICPSLGALSGGMDGH